MIKQFVTLTFVFVCHFNAIICTLVFIFLNLLIIPLDEIHFMKNWNICLNSQMKTLLSVLTGIVSPRRFQEYPQHMFTLRSEKILIWMPVLIRVIVFPSNTLQKMK